VIEAKKIIQTNQDKKYHHGPTDHRHTTEPPSTEFDPVPVTPQDFSTTQAIPGDRLQPEQHSLSGEDPDDLPGVEARGHRGWMQETRAFSFP